MLTGFWGYSLWAVILVLQQFAHGLSSRAKNSSSLLYNCLASVLSNGVWFASNFILVDNFVKILRDSAWERAAVLAVFYTFFCVLGSCAAQWLAMTHIEKRAGWR